MGSIGETVEEIIAEEDEPTFFESLYSSVGAIISGYGWYFLAGGAAAYYLWKNYSPRYISGDGAAGSGTKKPLTAAETADFQKKEEARQKYIARLQEQYERDAVIKAEKDKQLEEDKRKARLAELERLDAKGGSRLGSEAGTSGSTAAVKKSDSKGKSKSSSQSLRPEYNPLMGETRSRTCFSRSSGRSGG